LVSQAKRMLYMSSVSVRPFLQVDGLIAKRLSAPIQHQLSTSHDDLCAVGMARAHSWLGVAGARDAASRRHRSAQALQFVAFLA
jgi:hypothetical protein